MGRYGSNRTVLGMVSIYGSTVVHMLCHSQYAGGSENMTREQHIAVIL